MARQPAVQTTDPTSLDRVAGWGRRHGFAIRVSLFFVLAITLFSVTYFFYSRTTQNSYAHELVVAALGALVTVVAAAGAAALALWREIRERRQMGILRRFDEGTWRHNSIRVGRMEIPDIVVVASCNQERAWTSNVRYEFADIVPSRADATELPELMDQRLSIIVARAKAEGVTLSNDPCVDLVAASMSLRIDESGRRDPVYELVPAPTDYFSFVVTSADLDSPKATKASGQSLRQRWDRWPAGIEDVKGLPSPAKIGVGTAVVTADGRLVLGVRGRTFIVGRTEQSEGRPLLHVAAEGMLLGDLNAEGRLDPRETALRALREEMNIGMGSTKIGRVNRLTATGFFFDQLRWQPCFSYLAEIDLTWDELQTVAPMAPDYWEVERLECYPFDIRDAGLRYLLTGSHPDHQLASNHAAAALWFALLHRHGFLEMRDALSHSSSVYHPAIHPEQPQRASVAVS